MYDINYRPSKYMKQNTDKTKRRNGQTIVRYFKT